MKLEEAIKLFGLNNLMIESEIRRIEKEHSVDLSRRYIQEQNLDQKYYLQFSEQHRAEAHRMSTNYEIFYCLENSIREIIVQRLEEEFGDDWWNSVVPDAVKKNAEKNQKKEMESGFTLRSKNLIDFTSFGELGEIIKANWDTFSDLFRESPSCCECFSKSQYSSGTNCTL